MYIRRKIGRWKINRKILVQIEENEPVDSQLRDINFKGCCIGLEKILPKDKPIDLKLIWDEKTQLSCKGWVLWNKKIEKFYFYGLCFIQISEEDKEKIYRLIKESYPEELKRNWWQLKTEEGGERIMEDRRVFQRFPVRTNLRYLTPQQMHEVQAETTDISAKGLGLITHEELKPHTPLELWITLPGKHEPIYLRGEAIWSKPVSSREYRVGVALEKVEFINFSSLLSRA